LAETALINVELPATPLAGFAFCLKRRCLAQGGFELAHVPLTREWSVNRPVESRIIHVFGASGLVRSHDLFAYHLRAVKLAKLSRALLPVRHMGGWSAGKMFFFLQNRI